MQHRAGLDRTTLLRVLRFPDFRNPDSLRIRIFPLPDGPGRTLPDRVIRLDSWTRSRGKTLIELARDGSAVHRVARRANALMLLATTP
jgi:hypothetical protein